MSARFAHLLTTCAVLTLVLSWGGSTGVAEPVALAGGLLWALAGAVLRRLGRRPAPERGIGVLALAMLGMPVAGEAALRLRGGGSGPEFVLLAGLANVAFLLAALPGTRWFRLLLPVSLSVCAFSFCLSSSPLGAVCAAAHVVLLVVGLARGYWRGAGNVRSLAVAGAVGAAAGVVFLGALAWSGGRSVAALASLVPGSGGSAGSDPFGRGGVGEGEGEVGATHKTEDIGFAETDIFVESTKRSLYDAVDEEKGEPRILPKRENDRKVALMAREILENERLKVPARPEASRAFSTLRRTARPRASQNRNADARALLYARGRTPMHLRLTAYERYDGVRWHEGRLVGHRDFLIEEPGYWLRLPNPLWPDVFGAEERQEVRVGQLVTNRLPAPAQVFRLRVGKVNRPDFYHWAQAEILRMDVAQLPGGTTVETVSRTLDPRKAARRTLRPDLAARRQLPPDYPPRASVLAREWVRGVPPGWRQVEAVVAGLRRHALHAPRARVPDDRSDALGWFLEARRGPDYLFATAAALMLRDLGYTTRLVSGFYVSGERPDLRTGLHPVHGGDLHFWVEVLLDAAPEEESVWVPVEPTPGYGMRSPLPTWGERVRLALERGGAFATRHAAAILSLCGVLGALWTGRAAVGDQWGWLCWRWWAWRSPRRSLVEAARLIDTRARRAGCCRPPGTTPARHYRVGGGDPLAELLRAVDWARYDHGDDPALRARAREIGEQALRVWTRRRFARERREGG